MIMSKNLFKSSQQDIYISNKVKSEKSEYFAADSPIFGVVGIAKSERRFQQNRRKSRRNADRRLDSKRKFFLFFHVGDRRSPIAER